MMEEKSFIALYRVSPISFPRMEERHRPRTKARTTADKVSMTGWIAMVKYGDREISAVAAILSSASALIKLGNRLSATRKDAEPAIRVEP